MDRRLFEIREGELPLEEIRPGCGFLSIFRKVGVVGDSLSAGEFESRDHGGRVSYHDMHEYSWPSILARITGAEWHNYSRGGMSAREFLGGYAEERGFFEKLPCLIVSLGTNDLFVYHHPLGSAEDVHPLSPEENPDTFLGNIGRIVSRYKELEPELRFFLVGPMKDGSSPLRDSLVEKATEELGKAARLFSHGYLLDMARYGIVWDEEARSRYGLGYHPNPMGYHAYALMVGNYIDYLIRANMEDFKEVPFIGTGLSYLR